MASRPLLHPTFWAYLAGLVDGEGSLGIYPKYVRLDIANTDCATLRALRDALGCGYVQTAHHARHRPCCHLLFGANALRWMLPELMPFLRIKRPLAELLNTYLNSGRWVRGHAPLPDEVDRRAAIVAQVRAINGRRLAYGNLKGV